MYRIIGAYGGKAKLIKYDYATSDLLGTDNAYSTTTLSNSNYSSYVGDLTTMNTYFWNNATNKNTWSESNLNTINLNTNFIKNIGEEWASKIATTTWKVVGNTSGKIIMGIPSVVYKNEIVNPDPTNTSTTGETEYTAKIGLIYINDYTFAASLDAWTFSVGHNYSDNCYGSENVKSKDWMYIGFRGYEHTITRNSDDDDIEIVAFIYGNFMDGPTYGYGIINSFPVRPVFFLNPDVIYVSGTGTSSDQIRIN